MRDSVARSKQASRETEEGLLQTAREVFPGGVLGKFTLPAEDAFIPVRGRGAHFVSLGGRRYLDMNCGGGSMILGHRHPALLRAVSEQLARGPHFFSVLNEPAILLAERLKKIIACAEKVRFAMTGAEATFYALRLARAYTGKPKILKFEGAYHGHHDIGVTSLSPAKPTPFPMPQPETAGVPPAMLDTILVAPFNNLAATEEIVADRHTEIAAIIVEPLQRYISPGPGFLSGLRDLTRRYGICLIFDELVTGFRLALGGAQEYYGVVPDLACYGKALGGGFPLAAICGREDIMTLCDPLRSLASGYVYQSGTLNGHALMASAGLAVLTELAHPGVFDTLHRLGRRMRDGLEEICVARGVPAKAYGDGPSWFLAFTDQPITDYRSARQADAALLRRFHQELLRRGVFVMPGSKAYLSLAHTDRDIDHVLAVSDEALREVG